MQKRIKLEKQLKEIHSAYPPTWNKLISSLNTVTPLLSLPTLGSVAFIDDALYLHLDRQITKKWKTVVAALDLHKLFPQPENYTIQAKHLPPLEGIVLQYVSSFLQKLISNADRSIFLHVIDLQLLGKLVISKHSIEFINQQHNWKYTFLVDRVHLPRLMNTEAAEDENKQTIIKKMSLSLQKHSLSKPKEPKKAKCLRRSFSVSQLKPEQQSKQKLKTQTKEIVSIIYPKIEQPRPKIQSTGKKSSRHNSHAKTQSIQPSQKAYQSGNKQRTNSHFELKRASSPLRKPKRILTLESQPQKNKLSLTRQPKSFLPKERPKLKTDSEFQTRNIISQQIVNFIQKQSQCLIPFAKQHQLPHRLLHQYYTELSLIYQEKVEANLRKQPQKTRYLKELERQLNIKTFRKIKHNLKIPTLIIAEQQHFQQFYDLIETAKTKLKNIAKEYIVDYDLHTSFIQILLSDMQQLLLAHPLTENLSIQVALLLHQFYQELDLTESKILNKICHEHAKIIMIKINQEDNFHHVTSAFLNNFFNLFTLIQTKMQDTFPRYLQLPANLTTREHHRQQLNKLISICQNTYETNLSILKKPLILKLLEADLKSKPDSVKLIKQLQQLKQSIDEQVQFKSQILMDGIKLQMHPIKHNFLKLIDQKLQSIYKHYSEIYLTNENELNIKLREIIVINIDFLNDNKCREYKERIEQHYHEMTECLTLIISHLFAFLKPTQLQTYLDECLLFKEQIKSHFLQFQSKLQQYKRNSYTTVKILQGQNKQNKKIYQQLNQQLKKLLKSLHNEKSILEQKENIKALNKEFQIYNALNQKTITLMQENQMIFWEDDTHFQQQLQLLNTTLRFIDNQDYKIIHATPLQELNVEKFYQAFQNYSEFVTLLENSSIEKIFKPTFELIEGSKALVEVFLYKSYRPSDQEKFKELNIDVDCEKNSKVVNLIKKYQALEKRTGQKMVEIYQEAKLNEYNSKFQFNHKLLVVDIATDQLGLSFISNLEDISKSLGDKNCQKYTLLLQQLQHVHQLYQEASTLTKIVSHISPLNLSEQTKAQVLDLLNESYLKLLKLEPHQADIQIFQRKLEQLKGKYIQLFFKQKINVFPRYCLHSLTELISLSDWQTPSQIEKNIKILYQEVDAVTFRNDREVEAIIIGKDKLWLEKPIKIETIEGEKAKAVFMNIDNFLRSSLTHSEHASVQIKILIWYIYFTQQIELSFMTESPLSKLKESLEEIISEIANQIRYDLKLHHKTYEITQLKMFIAHIDKISAIHDINNFEWTATVRYYDKAKVIKVKQHDREYDYGFDPKLPINIDPNFQLIANVSYGFNESASFYRISAYILGQPFKTFERLDHYGFSQNYKPLISIISKYGYFIRIIMNSINFRSANYLHKKILKLKLKKENLLENDTLSLPIFFEYQNEAQFPPCFPEKMRTFSTPEFTISLNFVLLLKLNKYYQLLDQRRINVHTLSQTMTYLAEKKHLTIKNIDDFVNSFAKFIENNNNREDIQKFCFKYIATNYQLDDQELTNLLLQLINNQPPLESIISKLTSAIEEFKTKDKKVLIIYGPASLKTHVITPHLKSANTCQISDNNALYHLEGFHEYLLLKQQNKELPYRFLIEDRHLWQAEPAQLTNCELFYLPQLNTSNVEIVFRQKLSNNKIQGNHVILWKMFQVMHQAYNSLTTTPVSRLLMAELTLLSLQQHLEDFLSQLLESERQFFRITINKDIIQAFTVITHEIYYYLLRPELRKQFTEQIKQSSLLDSFRNEELSSITCKGIHCEKVLNMIKRQKLYHLRMLSFVKEVFVCEKYLKYNKTVVIDYRSHCTLGLVLKHINESQPHPLKIALNQKYLHLLRKPSSNEQFYIIEDIHLSEKPFLTHLKNLQQQPMSHQFLLTTQNSAHQQALKQHFTAQLNELEPEEIFKMQAKENIMEHFHQKSRLLWETNYFSNKEEFIFFLSQTTVKLPVQFYRKFYSRELINRKLTLETPCHDTISHYQALLKEVLNFNSEQFFMLHQKEHLNQLTELEVSQKIETALTSCSYLQKIITKEHYKDILPYALLNRIYLVIEEIHVLPKLITAIHGRKLYTLKQNNFIEELIRIVTDVYINEAEFTVVVEEPLSSQPQWLEFFDLYLKELNLIKYYDEFQNYLNVLILKEEYIYRRKNQERAIENKLLHLLYNKMKLIVSLSPQHTHLYLISQCHQQKTLSLNCALSPSKKNYIVKVIIDKIAKQQHEAVAHILHQYEDIFIFLTVNDLVGLNRLHSFLEHLTSEISLKLEELKKLEQQRITQVQFLNKLHKIKDSFKNQLVLAQEHERNSKIVLQTLLELINHQPQAEIPIELQTNYFEQLEKIRNKFFTLHDKVKIRPDNQLQQEFQEELKSSLFPEAIVSSEPYTFFSLSPKHLETLILDKQINEQAVKLFQKHNRKEVEEFILFKYFKYTLNIAEEYQKIDYTPAELLKQTRQTNYFYLLDLSIELKKQYQLVADSLLALKDKVNIIEQFSQAFTQVQLLDVDPHQLQQLAVFQRLKKIVRNYSVEQNHYQVQQLLQQYEQQFRPVRQQTEEFILNEEENYFDRFNERSITEQETLIIYDPFWKIQTLAHKLSIRIVYLQSEADLEEIHQYKFGMTLYCLRLNSVKHYLDSQQLIERCLDILSKKHKDLEKNRPEKLVLSLSDKSILTKITAHHSMVNLDFTLTKFQHLICSLLRKSNTRWNSLKQQYQQHRLKLEKYIQFMRNISDQELCHNILQLQSLITEFVQKRKELKGLAAELDQQEQQKQTNYLHIYQTVNKLDSNLDIAFNLSLRLLPKINIREISDKFEHYQPSHQHQFEEYLKTVLLQFKPDQIQDQVIDCLKQSRYIVVLYDQFNHQKIKDILRIQQSKAYSIRTLIDIDQTQINELFYLSSQTSPHSFTEIVLLFAKRPQLKQIKPILGKCALICI